MVENNTKPIKVMCVDDNPLVTEALKLQFRDLPDIRCIRTASSADEMLDVLNADDCPDIVLLDYDMPGKPSFDAISELEGRCADARVIIFTGYVGKDLVDQALDAGAWGYVAKVDTQDDLVQAIRQVAAGTFAFSPAVRSATMD